MAFFRAGDLIHRIVIEQPDSTQDALGRSGGWSVFAADVPAEVQDLAGRETYLAAQRFVSQVSHVVRMRYMPGVSATMRVNWLGRLLVIQAALNPDGKMIEHRLVCLESSTNA
jgi:SPP1 family predicted phage head-tail adaptor